MQPQRQVPHAARPSAVPQTNLTAHRAPQGRTDRLALRFVKVLRLFADAIFAKRYGHRAVALETVAAVPGMVGGLLQHLKALRHIRDDHGWIRELLDAAKKRRMHLMTFVQIAQPTRLERAVNMAGQMIFYNFYFFPYRFAPRAARRPSHRGRTGGGGGGQRQPISGRDRRRPG